MVIVTGPATDENVGPNRRQGFLDGLTEGGVKYDIKSEQNGDYAQDKGQVAAENMLAANPDVDLVLGLNDSMALGAYNVIKDKAQYKNVYVAASADGQKEALALIKEGGCTGKYISTGLNSPSLAAEQALSIAVDIATGVKKPADYPTRVFHPGGRHRLPERRQVLQPGQYFLSATGVDAQLLQQPGRGRRVRDDVGELGFDAELHAGVPSGVQQHIQCGPQIGPGLRGLVIGAGAPHVLRIPRVPVHSVTTSAPSSAAWVIRRTAWAVCWARNSRSGWMTL